jgi:hypothetical protein
VTTFESAGARRAESRWVIIGVVAMTSLLCAQVVVGLLREPEPSHLEKVQTCLTERSTPYEPVSQDPLAMSAGRGALVTTVDGNRVTVSLGSSEKDAERVYRTYVALAPADVVETRLERNRKVVFLWEDEPTAAQREFMVLCTLDAQE